LKTLQIATIGKESESVMIGIRNFPVHKLALICQENDIDSVKNTSIELKQVLKLPVDIYPLKGEAIERPEKGLRMEKHQVEDKVSEYTKG